MFAFVPYYNICYLLWAVAVRTRCPRTHNDLKGSGATWFSNSADHEIFGFSFYAETLGEGCEFAYSLRCAVEGRKRCENHCWQRIFLF